MPALLRPIWVLSIFASLSFSLSGCQDRLRPLSLISSLPTGCEVSPATQVEVTALGDFPLDPTHVVSIPPDGRVSLSLPSATRVVLVEGFGPEPKGLIAFGRTASLVFSQLPGEKLPVAYGPPNGLCRTGSLNHPRAGHRATLLSSGNVLISGGTDLDGMPVGRLELYLPLGDATTPPAHFRVVDAEGATELNPRANLGHAVSVLRSGTVFITGGAPATAGLPDGTAHEGATLHRSDGVASGRPLVLGGGPRAFHSATTLPDGRVLLAGGCAIFKGGSCTIGSVLHTTVLYQPETDQFSAGPPLIFPRWDHDAILRGDGSVLLVGGRGEEGSALPGAELIDPSELRERVVGATSGRAALLPNGAVAVVGGIAGVSATRHAGLFIDSDAPDVPLPSLPEAVKGQTVTALEDGSLLVAGGVGEEGPLPSLGLYHDGGRFSQLGGFSRLGHSATRLSDGSVLFAGGTDGNGVPLSDAQIFFRSPLGPFSSLNTLTFSDVGDPFSPVRPDRATLVGGELRIDGSSATSEPERGLLSAVQVNDFDLFLLVGREAAGGAALLFGFLSEADYYFVSLEVGQPVMLHRVAGRRPGLVDVTAVEGCAGVAVEDGELPQSGVSDLSLDWRDRTLSVSSRARLLLRCRPKDAPKRGAVGLGARHGPARFDNVTLLR